MQQFIGVRSDGNFSQFHALVLFRGALQQRRRIDNGSCVIAVPPFYCTVFAAFAVVALLCLILLWPNATWGRQAGVGQAAVSTHNSIGGQQSHGPRRRPDFGVLGLLHTQQYPEPTA
jgi:hypothetical protein